MKVGGRWYVTTQRNVLEYETFEQAIFYGSRMGAEMIRRQAIRRKLRVVRSA
jgi:hypothetical protein